MRVKLKASLGTTRWYRSSLALPGTEVTGTTFQIDPFELQIPGALGFYCSEAPAEIQSYFPRH